MRSKGYSSLVPSPSLQLSLLAVRIMLGSVIRTASDDSCGEGLGTRLNLDHVAIAAILFWERHSLRV